MLESSTRLREINENLTLINQKYHSSFPFSGRDFIMVIKTQFV